MTVTTALIICYGIEDMNSTSSIAFAQDCYIPFTRLGNRQILDAWTDNINPNQLALEVTILMSILIWNDPDQQVHFVNYSTR